MAEFKINEALDAQVTSLSTAGAALASSGSDDPAGCDGMQAAVKFAEQNANIKKLLSLYSQLVTKDAADITAMIETARAKDEAISSAM